MHVELAAQTLGGLGIVGWGTIHNPSERPLEGLSPSFVKFSSSLSSFLSSFRLTLSSFFLDTAWRFCVISIGYRQKT
jgi:hypothetical protein